MSSARQGTNASAAHKSARQTTPRKNGERSRRINRQKGRQQGRRQRRPKMEPTLGLYVPRQTIVNLASVVAPSLIDTFWRPQFFHRMKNAGTAHQVDAA